MVAGNALGELLRSRRKLDSRDPLTARPYTQARVGELAGFSGSKYASLEQGDIQFLSPDDARALAHVLPVTVTELCAAMGYDVATTPEPITEDEAEMLRLYQRLSPDQRSVARRLTAALPEPLQERQARTRFQKALQARE